MENLDDLSLVKLARDGDAVAFETLAKRHYMLVYQVSYRWCGNQDDSEDITQEVFVKLARKIHEFKEESTFQTWLYRITMNTAKDFARANGRRRVRESTFAEEEKGKAIGQAQEKSLSEKLYGIIEELPLKLKETTLLVFGEGLNHKEAAQALNCAETTISWRIFQVKKKLKKYLNMEESHGAGS